MEESYNKRVPRNMSEAIILWVIQTLEYFLVENTSIDTNNEQIIKEVINEMIMMLDFLREKDSGERSRLKYLLADYAELAQLSVTLTIQNDALFYRSMETNLDSMSKTRKRMVVFGAGEGVSSSQSVGEEGVVVGLEKDVEQLIGRVILNKEPGLVNSCIKGMVGVGKTTLARQVYNHPAVVEKFKHRAWVSLTNDTSINEVLVELIQQLVEVNGDSLLTEEMDNQSLRQMLQKNIEETSYFIVLDNIPKAMELSYTMPQLPKRNGCRLLFTCRYRVEGIYYTHEMKPLDYEKSWQLFLKIFDKFTNDENKFPKELEIKGKVMLKKCGGLPVAIIDIGRQKAKQRLSGVRWEELFDSIDLGESLKLLEPMYHELDEELKQCFLYMSFFKENVIMRQEKLEQIWAICGTNITEPSSCTYNLVGESIIEVVHDFRFYSLVKRCRINPLLHMLSIKIAKEELGLEILRNNENDRPSQSPRHLVIHCGRDKFNHSKYQDKNLISLIFHGGGGYLDDASPSYWKSFELLSVLDMEDFGVKTLSKTIGILIELRYLGLRNNHIQEIPHSLGSLKKLEVFDIAQNFMVEVPDIINEMGNLRHLYMSDVICRKPLKVDVLQNLTTLSYISIYDWSYEVSSLEKIIHLHKLGIEEVDENSDVRKLFQSLAKLKSYKWLTIRGFRFESMPCLDEIRVLDRLMKLKLNGRLARLPSATNFLSRILYVVLVNTCLDEDPMLVLQKISTLVVIKLRNAYTGRQMVIKDLNLPALKILRINELWNLRDVQVGHKAMPFLKELEIKNCPYLETLPEEIKVMDHLRKFKMVTTKHIATKIRNSSLLSKIVEVDISP